MCIMNSDFEDSNVGSTCNASTINRMFYFELFMVALGVFLGMFAYEFLKSYFLPELTIWQSHFITIAFSTIMATLAAYIILKRRNHFTEEITKKRDDYKSALDKLELSEKKFQEVFNHANDMISLNSLKNGLLGNFIEVNEVCMEKLGYTRDEFLKMKPQDIIAPDKQLKIAEITAKLIKERKIDLETVILSKDGKRIPVEINNCIFTLHGEEVVIAVSRDITERKQAEEEIKQSLEEKELLLKEVHHRVKNNLAIISSLLNLQSYNVKDEKARDSFREIQNRTRSMALIHEKLYKSTDLKRINFGEYISTISTELFRTYADPARVKLKTNVEDIYLDINTAIPLGLIINEIITNSFKHAFPGAREGEIQIDFHKKDHHYEFQVKDNGVGFPDDLDFKNTDTLGLQLVNSLTKQIDGEISLKKDHGTQFTIKFQE